MGGLIILGIIIGVRILIEVADDGPKSLPYKSREYDNNYYSKPDFRKAITNQTDYCREFSKYVGRSNTVLTQLFSLTNFNYFNFLNFAKQTYKEYRESFGKTFPSHLKNDIAYSPKLYQSQDCTYYINNLNIYYCYIRNIDRNEKEWKIEVGFWAFYDKENRYPSDKIKVFSPIYEESFWVFSRSFRSEQWLATNFVFSQKTAYNDFWIKSMLKKPDEKILIMPSECANINLKNLDKVAIQIAKCHSKKDLLGIKPFVSEDLYGSISYLIDQFTNRNLYYQEEELRLLDYRFINNFKDKNNKQIVECQLFFESYNYIVDNNENICYGDKDSLIKYSQIWTIVYSQSSWRVDSIIDYNYYRGKYTMSNYKLHKDYKYNAYNFYIGGVQSKVWLNIAYNNLADYQKVNPEFSLVEFKDAIDEIYRKTLCANNNKNKEFVDNIIQNKILLKRIFPKRREDFFVVDVCYDFSKVQDNNQIYYYRKKDRLTIELSKEKKEYNLFNVKSLDFSKLKTQEILNFVKQELPMLPTQYGFDSKNFEKLQSEFLQDNPLYESMDEFYSVAKFDFCTVYNNWKKEKLCMIEDILMPKIYQNILAILTQYSNYSFYNYIDGVEATDVELIAYHKDQKYKRIVVRIYANSYNYTIDGNADVYGNAKKRSKYSEYWTFVCPIDQEEKWKVLEIIQDEMFI